MEARPVSPKITVVIPLHNKVTQVERAVQGVITQTVSDFELIVVDDGSTDGSAEVVRRLATDTPIRIIAQANAGESAARNAGITVANSDLVAFCDADDEWKPGFLEAILSLRSAFPQCDVFGTSYVLREPQGDRRTPVLRGLPEQGWRGVLEDYFAIAGYSDPPMCSSSVAAKRTALEEIGGFPNNVEIGGDLLTWARLAARYEVGFDSRPYADVWLRARFGVPPGGTPTRIPDADDVVGRELVAILRELPAERRSNFRRVLAQWHRMRAEMFVRLDQRENALREVRLIAKYSTSISSPFGLALLALSPRPLRRAGLKALSYVTGHRRRERR
jgi:glycosyltransferase involved in cell wall biosynthesis